MSGDAIMLVDPKGNLVLMTPHGYISSLTAPPSVGMESNSFGGGGSGILWCCPIPSVGVSNTSLAMASC